MTEQRLAELVARMREAQKEARYWRDQQHYIAARHLEREVDALLLQIIHERQAFPSPQEQA
jgi:guanylate kinase